MLHVNLICCFSAKCHVKFTKSAVIAGFYKSDTSIMESPEAAGGESLRVGQAPQTRLRSACRS